MAGLSYSPNLDAIATTTAPASPEQMQVLLLRAGFQDICMLLRDIRKQLEDLNRNQKRAMRANDQPNQEEEA